MIECPKCKQSNWRPKYKSPVYPERDTFQCLECWYVFERYEGTIYESKSAKEIKEIKPL